jgi:hypothetical protein
MEKVFVPKSQEEKKMQRALLQYRKPENRSMVEKAYKIAGKSLSGNTSKTGSKGKQNASNKEHSKGNKTARSSQNAQKTSKNQKKFKK